MQGVLRRRTAVQEHILFQEWMVHPLEHALHQDEVEQEGGCVAPFELRLRHCGRFNAVRSVKQWKKPKEYVKSSTIIVVKD